MALRVSWLDWVVAGSSGPAGGNEVMDLTLPEDCVPEREPFDLFSRIIYGLGR